MLTRAEIERMKASVLPPVDNNFRASRKAELKQLSNDRMENWPNTLEALRKKKESFTKDREEKEERRRQEIDREEAELRKSLRLESIRRANELLYDQTDKMKMLKGQKLYADVLVTRADQIVEKQKAREREQRDEQDYHEFLMQKVRDAELAEARKLEEKKEALRMVGLDRKKQLDSRLLVREHAEHENRLFGQSMKAKAQEMLDEEIREAEERKRIIRERNEKTLLANAQLKNLKDQMTEKERIAEKARDAEAEVIEDRKKIRKAIEQRRFEKQQIKRQQLIDAATARMNAFQSKEQEILNKQISDKEEKDAQILREKEEKKAREWQAIVKSRSDQIVAKQEALIQRKQEEEEMVRLLREKAEEDRLAEIEKDRRAKESVRILKAMQQREAVGIHTKKVEERMARIEQEKLVHGLVEQDDQKFTEICKATIVDYASKGKPVYTLLRALEHTQPDLLASKTQKVTKKAE